MLGRVRASARSTLVMVGLAAALGGALARAQEGTAPVEPPEPPPTPGDAAASIATGFTPDPLRASGVTVGARPLSSIAGGCRGYVGEAPDRVLRLETRFGFLRFFVTAASDVTLAIRGPDGQFRCTGRPLDGAPREEGRFAPGRYEIWIGSLQPGAAVAYELHVTEFRSVGPGAGRGAEDRGVVSGQELGLEVRAERGRFPPRELRRGFLPDPRTDPGTAGGSIDVTPLGGGCRGHVDARPSHVLTLVDPFDYFRISVENASAPATLVVRAPLGGYLCSAPDEGPPTIARDAWPPGRYLVWVGSRSAGATPSYRVEYSETRRAAE